MRRTATRTLAITTTTVAVVLALAVPSGALAAGGAPDEMVDPVAAMEPEIEVGAPAAENVGAGAETPAANVPDVQATAVDEATAGATAAPVQPTISSSGSLPFTGPEPGLLILLLLVGLVAVLGGVTAIGYGRALAESA
jgi:hypothetical protein